MQQKKRGRALAVCLALCFTLLCGGTFVSHAVTPVCGGDHCWHKIRSVQSVRVGDVYSHNHNGHICWVETWQDMALMKCDCGWEEVYPDGNPYLVHHIDYSH